MVLVDRAGLDVAVLRRRRYVREVNRPKANTRLPRYVGYGYTAARWPRDVCELDCVPLSLRYVFVISSLRW
jgi:hypothetical protein